MATNGNLNHQDQYAASTSASDSAATANSGGNLSKDEVGWYFVEQYYTTLSKNPDKLHVSATPELAPLGTIPADNGYSYSTASDPSSSMDPKQRLPMLP